MLRFLRLLLPCLVLSASIALSAQTHWSGEGSGTSLWVGAEFSTYNADYGCGDSSPFSCGGHELLGISPFADLDHVFFQRLNIGAQARFLHWHGPANGLTESSYLVGPEFNIWRFRRLAVFSGKVSAGDANISIPRNRPGNGNHFAVAPGIIADFRVSRRILARAEYEYQFWPNFEAQASTTTTGKGGLTPNGLSVGLAYRLKRQ